MKYLSFLLIGLSAFIFWTYNTGYFTEAEISFIVQEKVKAFPSDHLFAQRSYPSGMIDREAYVSSVESLRNYAAFQRGPFDNNWDFQGPTNISGRITDIEMPINNTEIVFAATASGGIFKSEDQGVNWFPIFDDQPSLSIGDMAIARDDPSIMYVGTGEANAGGGSMTYDGLGVYKSTDGGDTWEPKGLENVGSIGKVVIDPNDNERAYVAAMGHLYY